MSYFNQLAGDLGNTPQSPQVVNLHLSADTAINHKLTSVTDPTTAQDAATKNYVDTQITSNGTPDATTSTKGKVQLAGDLSGTAASPTVKSRTATVTVAPTGTAADYNTTGSADDVQIQAAINAANGGRVVLRKGAYVITHPLVLKPYQIFEGEGRQETIIQLDPGSLSNFSSNFMIQGRTGPATDCTVRHLSLDGNYPNLVSPPGNQGGLLEVQNGWTVDDVEFMTSNYFKLWANGVSNILVQNCMWTGTVGAGNDCIGGGGCTYLTAQRCRWVSSVNGNNFDHVNGQYYRLVNNYFTGGVYLEGVTDSSVEGNMFISCGPVVQSNGGYSPATQNMPLNNLVANNHIYESYIHIRYNSYSGATTTNHGGNNSVIGNKIISPSKGGILVDGALDGSSNQNKVEPDLFIGNQITNPNSDGTNTWNTGLGVFYNSGIILGYGFKDVVFGNTIIDTNSSPNMQYGICITGSSTTITADSPLVTGNSITNYSGIDGIVIKSPALLTGTPIIGPNTGSSLAYRSQSPGVFALTDGATIATNAALGNIFTVTIAGNRTMSNPTNAASGQRIEYQIKQDATGSRLITWGSAFHFSTDTPQPVLSTVANAMDRIAFEYNGTTTNWDCIGVSRGY